MKANEEYLLLTVQIIKDTGLKIKHGIDLTAP